MTRFYSDSLNSYQRKEDVRARRIIFGCGGKHVERIKWWSSRDGIQIGLLAIHPKELKIYKNNARKR